MPFPNTVTVLLTLLLAGMVIGPCSGTADHADTGNPDTMGIPLSISNNASEKNELNRTTGGK